MEPNNVEIEEKIPENKSTTIEEFPERIKEEVEDGYIDDRGFYTTPNGSFWDENGTYFTHIGLDKHGGRYDEYGVYQPGPNYNFDFNCYEDEIDKKNNKFFDEINENTKKTLEECFESNNQCVEEIDRIHEKNDDDDEENNCGLSEEEMQKIYNECIDIANQFNNGNNDNENVIKNVNNEKNENVEINEKENEEEKVTFIPNILLLSKNKAEERKNENINENDMENGIMEK